jgi:hypothetical protein
MPPATPSTAAVIAAVAAIDLIFIVVPSWFCELSPYFGRTVPSGEKGSSDPRACTRTRVDRGSGGITAQSQVKSGGYEKPTGGVGSSSWAIR